MDCVLDMIKCLNSSDLRMNDLNLYCELGAKASLFIELLNGGSETEQENSKKIKKQLFCSLLRSVQICQRLRILQWNPF